ncbi:DUF397 domain-containing protein [Streptomyces sp. enrichment culture]|uniref:DUF397 domain-containing protein n=1 Tax=Streptomyces sp. enrichment culture TaxID=1795815 RepID=UPI003F56E11D
MSTPQRIDEHDARDWRRSSHSNQDGGQCLEVADGHPGVLPVRDSKRPDGPVVRFGSGPWSAFVAALRGGQL